MRLSKCCTGSLKGPVCARGGLILTRVGGGGAKASPTAISATALTIHSRAARSLPSSAVGGIPLLISNVPSTEFTIPGQQLVLAMRIVGVKPVQVPLAGQVNVATGTYVGAYRCRVANCLDFFDC